MPSLSTISPGAAALPDLAADLAAGLASPAPGGAPATLTRRQASAGAAAKAPSAAKAATARKPTVRKKAASPKAPTTGYAATLPAAYAFLKDPNLSVEDKLLRFTMQVAKETNDDVVRRLEALAAKGGKAAAGGGTSGTGGTTGAPAPAKKKGFALWDVAKAVVPALGLASAVVGDAAVKGLVKQVSGPVLAAAATALGMPMLAPLALKAGPALADLVTSSSVDLGRTTAGGPSGSTTSATATGTSTPTSSSSSSSTGSAGTVTAEDRQQELMLLQHAMDKQKEMTALVSNMLRSMHDARMGVIQNLR